jgi:hypothetical protein
MQTDVMRPEGMEEIPLGMSNFYHSVDEGFEEALRAGGVFGRHAGWNFNGVVWFDADSQAFVEEVRVYCEVRGQFSAPTLRELMDEVNGKFGWD